MSAEHFQLIRAVFGELIELPEEERARALADRKDLPDEVRAEVEALLARPEQTLLDPGGLAGLTGQTANDARPDAIGPYKILDVLGRGGMGLVYLAEQTQPSRRVAIKVLRSGFMTELAAPRFEREAELLGKLQHPGIAQIHEFATDGKGDDAVNFIVMEYIDGRSLTHHASAHGLSDAERLGLLEDLADAVHHAHLRGVVHRDLKPANVLVTTEGQVKVIDFGVARLTDAEQHTLQTQVGEIVGTLAYMSPEQIRGDIDDIDARADVYALGVIAYELLGGRLPQDLAGASLTKAVRIVCEQDPPPLGRLAPAARGDLELIVAKALQKEPERRYASAAAFAADLARYRRNEPIEARAPSAFYQLSKLARRNRALFAGAAATLLAILIGAGVATRYAIVNARLAESELQARTQADLSAVEAERNAEQSERNAAEAEHQAGLAAQAAEAAVTQAELAQARADELELVSRFQASQLSDVDTTTMGLGIREALLADARAALQRQGLADVEAQQRVDEFARMLGLANPTNVALHTLRAAIFDRATTTIHAELADQPGVQARLLLSLADVQRVLGLYVDAEDSFWAALDILGELDERDDEQILGARIGLGLVYVNDARWDEAQAVLERALEDIPDVLGEQHELAVLALDGLSRMAIARGDLQHAESLLVELTDATRAAHGRLHPRVLNVIAQLGFVLAQSGRAAEAEQLLDETLASFEPTLLADDAALLAARDTLAVSVAMQGRHVEAEPQFREVLAGYRRLHGDAHPRVAGGCQNVATSLAIQGRFAEAEPFFAEALAGRRRVQGDLHVITLSALMDLAELYMALGRYADALPLAEEASQAATLLGEQAGPRGFAARQLHETLTAWAAEQDVPD